MVVPVANATSIDYLLLHVVCCVCVCVSVCVYIITRGRCFLKFDCNLGDHSLCMYYPLGKTVLQVV